MAVQAGSGRSFRPVLAYLGLCALAVVTVPLVSEMTARVVLVGLSGLGVLALAVGVRRQRPAGRAGWWLLVAGLSGVFLTGVWVIVVYSVRGAVAIAGPGQAVLTVLTYGLITAGLARLQRVDGQRGWSNAVDAVIAGLVAFLVVWVVVLQPVAERGSVRILGTVLLPIGVLVALAMLARLLLTVGTRSRAVILLVAALALLFAGGLALAVPALRGENLNERPVAAGLAWIGYCVLVGVAGLDPSLGRLRAQPPRPEPRPTRAGVLLLACVVLLGPIAATVEMLLTSGLDDRRVGALVALAVGLVLALLLVVRVTQLGLEANRRADELSAQTQALSRSVTAERQLREQLTYQTLHDPLTGLGNRLVLSERVDSILDGRGGRHALVLFDIDSFKMVNDTLGRPAGDDVLVETSRRLLTRLPRDATPARVGGDEFAVLLEDRPLDECLQWTELTRHHLGDPYHRGGSEVFLTVSAGVVELGGPGEPTAPSDAMRDADIALHAAKAQGRDQVTVFRPDLRSARSDQARLTAALRQAVDRESLSVYYQPVVDLTTGEVVATEALLRWRPDGGPAVPPDVFIPLAEETGLIRPIGRWTLHRVCREARDWYRTRRVPVAVNVSGWQLDDPTFADQVLRALATAGLPGRALILEVTESTLITDDGGRDRVEPLRRLRAHGVRVAVDDFGTGYSSLAAVARLPVDIIKIDKSFISGEDQGAPGGSAGPFAKVILQLAASLDLLTIAEGVETPEQADALRRLCCTMAQGYLYARPLPPAAMTALLAANPHLPPTSA